MKSRKGFNLVEAVIAMVIIAVAAAGTLSCEFFVAKHSRQARAEMIAARTVQLLLDDWKACKGTENYDPVASLNCGFTQASGKYLVTVDALPLYLSLSSADINSTANTQNNSLALTTYCQ
ncbi:MAG: hypothetical protein BWY69_00225 [Planctomycetes bacterium ADurb.Bin401]|nr:MAG: hypothetical protein BWY69_00225 [Planctomycetes bacterium ADurb.Bin401]